MTRGGFTPLRFLLAAVLLGATAAPGEGLPPVPAESDVKVYDRSSDDGSALIVEWVAPLTRTEAIAKAKAEAEKNRETLTEEQLLARIPPDAVDVTYVVQIAKRREDFDSGDFKTTDVVPGPKTRKSGNPKYFGFSPANRESCFAEILPSESEFFPPEDPWSLEMMTEALSSIQTEVPEDLLKAVLSLEGGKGDNEPTPAVADTLDRVLRLWLAQRVKEGVLTKAEAKRVAEVWPSVDAFEREAATAKKEAEAVRAEVDEVFKKTRAARMAAEIALGEADGDAKQAARQALKKAKAAEKKAKANLKDATRKLEWAKETVRRKLPADQRRELDWFVRLKAHLDKRREALMDTAKRDANAKTYYVRLAVSDGSQAPLVTTGSGSPAIFSAAARPDLFKWFTLNNLVFAAAFTGIVLVFIQIARRNPNLFLRKIPGLDAVEEAIGRATEMGRPAFFVHGFGSTGSMSTIAALNILSRVAHQAAEYDTRVRVMNLDPIVTAVSQEVVQQAYTEAGRPDAFDADDVVYMTNDQFSYAAAVAGRMMREQPAAIFLIGYFMAESLLLAETGAATGAIQVAGTDAEHQLPFFITTCDYTLIGEELYAASAYLSREPRMLGSLRGQDVGKAFMMAAMVVGIILVTIFVACNKDTNWITQLFEAF